MPKAALITLNAGDDPLANLPVTCDLIEQAAGAGAQFVLTPEVTNCVSTARARQEAVLHLEAQDPTLAALRGVAQAQGIWLLIGSLALKTGETDGRFANRSFLISPDGEIAARYDKIHMFDVSVSETETYFESKGYRPGTQASVTNTPMGRIGMTICYDVRFPALYRALAQGGAQIITVPAAFSPVTGAAHWEVLLRARAIECGTWIFAPAQSGTHKITTGKPRATYGHSLVVAPWGEVVADGGTQTGVTLFDYDLSAVDEARARVPSLTHDRPFDLRPVQ
ncbi:2-oxoglutaramate amidase [Aquimixticola soesokkakensis]|uniref:2-oxoglutaramate amidase n=1 Tax=Aquimixticola soesokkakensis TaxID=1519096 RepID=A0A1Y5R7P9_9RHOB|nr:carbon-nitrogen hydrolase family protein [Aquimixticola soesokkakensis]SLN11031.1 2-oxoglutaramate amidase [Aquimixticola soesokkakensis]